MRVPGEGIKNLAFFDGLIGNIPMLAGCRKKVNPVVIPPGRDYHRIKLVSLLLKD